MVGGNKKYCLRKFAEGEAAELRVKMVENLGVKRYSVRQTFRVGRQNSKDTCQMQGMRKRKLLCYIMKHNGCIIKKYCYINEIKIKHCQSNTTAAALTEAAEYFQQ